MTKSSGAANTPPPTRFLARLTLADSTTLEIKIPGVTSWSVSNYRPCENEELSIFRVDVHGCRRRGRLAQILGDGS